MIEINVKAKPFNPAEEVLGVELFWMMEECHLIGWHYFSDKPPAEKKKEVLVIPKAGKFGITVDMIIKKFPHHGGNIAGEINVFENDTAKVLVTASWELYDNWLKDVVVS